MSENAWRVEENLSSGPHHERHQAGKPPDWHYVGIYFGETANHAVERARNIQSQGLRRLHHELRAVPATERERPYAE